MSAPGFPGPAGFSSPPQPQRRGSVGMVVSIVAAATAVVALLGVLAWNFLISPVSADPAPGPTPTIRQPDPTVSPPPEPTPEPTPTPTPDPSPTPPPEPPPFPAGSAACPKEFAPEGGITESASGNSVTSCPFAEQVRLAYGRQPLRNTTVDILAHSPVTDITYNLTCVGDRLVTCQGGQNAVVHLR